MGKIDEFLSETTSDWWGKLTTALQDDDGNLWLDLTCQGCVNPLQEPQHDVPDIVLVEPSPDDSVSDIGFLHQDRHRQGHHSNPSSSPLPPHLVIHRTQHEQRKQRILSNFAAAFRQEESKEKSGAASCDDEESPKFMDAVRTFVRSSSFSARVLLGDKEECAKHFSSNALVLEEGHEQQLNTANINPLEGTIVTTTKSSMEASSQPSKQRQKHHHNRRRRRHRSKSRSRRRSFMYDGHKQHQRAY